MGKENDIRAVRGNSSIKLKDDSMTDCIDPEELAKMKAMDIRKADVEKLVDIQEIKVDSLLSDTEKKREFIRQIRNPYLYRQGEYVVKLSFADTDATLTDRLKEYIEHVAADGLY